MSSTAHVSAFETEGAPPFGLRVPHSFGDPVHQDITSQGLDFLKPNILKILVDEHVKIEADQSSPNHFDNCQFTESTQRINTRYAVAVSFLDPNKSDHALAAKYFSEILHASQDFYAHSNWVEMRRTDLIDSTLGQWQVLNGYSESNNDSSIFVLEEDGKTHQGINIRMTGKSVSVSHKDWDARKPALISGTFDAGTNKCPAKASIPHGAKVVFLRYSDVESLSEDDELNKDNPIHKGHAKARELATDQTTHEFCRLVNLVENRWKQEGVDNLYDNWVANKNDADAACNMITDTGTKISDPTSESKNKASVGQKIKPEKSEKIVKTDTNKITEKQTKKDKVLVQKNNVIIKETKQGDTKIIEYDDGTIKEETGFETSSIADDEIVTKYQNGTVSTWTRLLQRTVTIHTDGTIVRSEYGDSGVFGTTTRYPNGTSIRVTDVSTGITYQHGDISSKTIYRDGTIIIYPRGGDTFKITEFANGTKITESNDRKITKTAIGATTNNKKLTTSDNEMKISKDTIKKLYTMAKLHEGATVSLASVNDQQTKILQKATAAANKDLTKEQKTALKLLLKGQDSDKKDIKAIQEYAKKISMTIKKLAQKEGLKSSDLDKITKTVKSGKQVNGGPANQIKQDAINAKNNLDEVKKFQEELELSKIAVQIGNILPDSEGRSDFEKRMEDRFEEQHARESARQDREREQKLAKQQEEADEKSKQNVLDMMQQLLDLVQKDEQAQTDSILNTIPDPWQYERTQNKDPTAKTDPSKPVTDTTQPNIQIQSKHGTYRGPTNPCIDNKSAIVVNWTLSAHTDKRLGVEIVDVTRLPGPAPYVSVSAKNAVIQYASDKMYSPGEYMIALHDNNGKIISDSVVTIRIPDLCTATPPPTVLVEPGTGTNPPPKTNTKPSLTIPKQITREATGPSGAVVNFNVSGQDKEDGAITPSCSYPSDYMFPIGTSTVSCTVDDSDGNSISGTFTVTIQDTTPPNIAAFQPTEGVRDESGVQVFYEVSAMDLVDGAVQVSCNYPSGYKFPIGTTVLTCTSVDSHGNQSSRSLQITVTATQSGQ